MTADSPIDWRKLPRKPADKVRDCTITVRVTEAERSAMHDAAQAAGMSMTDYIVARALRKKARN